MLKMFEISIEYLSHIYPLIIENMYIITRYCQMKIKDNSFQFPSLRDIWLCQLCSETREMWKKTGAWFYKSLPSYKSSTMRSTSLTNTSRTERTKNRGIKVNDSSSDEFDDDATNDSEMGACARSNSMSISTKRSSSYFLERMNSLRLQSRPLNSTSSLNEDGFIYRKLSSLNLFGRSSSTLKCDTESNGQCGDNGGSSGNESTINGSVNRRDSEPSTSVSESSSTNDTNMCIGILSINSMPNHQICREQPMGWLDVSLIYSENEHTLDCTLLRARDLSAVEITCAPDPYARLNIVTECNKLKQKKWLQTRTVHKTRCPEFNETVRFFGVEPEELNTSQLYVVILDEDKYGSDFLGTAKIQLGLVSICLCTWINILINNHCSNCSTFVRLPKLDRIECLCLCVYRINTA